MLALLSIVYYKKSIVFKTGGSLASVVATRGKEAMIIILINSSPACNKTNITPKQMTGQEELNTDLEFLSPSITRDSGYYPEDGKMFEELSANADVFKLFEKY